MLETKENEMLMDQAIECSDNANSIKYALVKLNAVQYVVSKLVEQLNELDHESLNGVGSLVINQLDIQVRMIDMALDPLTKDMTECSKSLSINAENLYRGIAKTFNQ